MAVVIDLVNDAVASLNLGPLAFSTTTQGASIDGYNQGVRLNMFYASAMTNSLQTTQLNVKAEESTDGTTWTDIPGMMLTVTSLGSSRAIQGVGGNRSQRYFRGNIVTLSAVTTVGAFVGSVIFFANKKYAPEVTGSSLYPST